MPPAAKAEEETIGAPSLNIRFVSSAKFMFPDSSH